VDYLSYYSMFLTASCTTVLKTAFEVMWTGNPVGSVHRGDGADTSTSFQADISTKSSLQLDDEFPR